MVGFGFITKEEIMYMFSLLRKLICVVGRMGDLVKAIVNKRPGAGIRLYFVP
jgi:hypothetical protein